MKTVSGKVVSSRPISLSKAAKLLSRFTASDNEASPAFAAYLRRTSAAFNQLVQIHKECKNTVGEFRDKKDRDAINVGEVKKKKSSTVKEEMENCSTEQKHERNAEKNDGVSDERKHKKKGSHRAAEESENVRNVETEAVDQKANRKRKHERVADRELDGSREAARSKKKKM